MRVTADVFKDGHDVIAVVLKLATYTYIYQSSYGSPEVDYSTPKIVSATPSADGLSVKLKVEGLKEGHVHDLSLDGVKSSAGQPLLHAKAYYTLNSIPAK